MDVYRSIAPLRVSFAGGGTDIPPYCVEHGGQVISTTIDKYVHITAGFHSDPYIRIHAYDLNKEYRIDLSDSEPPYTYDGEFDLFKAVLNRFDVRRGVDLHVYSDLPAATGMGTSSSLTVALIKLFSVYSGKTLGKYDVAEMACDIERHELSQVGGYQDQYAASFGGFNFITFGKSHKVHPLSLSDDYLRELNEWLVLCYTGTTHISAEVQKIVLSRYETVEFQKGMDFLKEQAAEIRDILSSQDISISSMERFGRALHNAWVAKKMLSNKISNENIERLYEYSRKMGVLGGKLLGAGGGGFLLLVVNPENRMKVVNTLESMGGRVVSFAFGREGARAWSVSD